MRLTAFMLWGGALATMAAGATAQAGSDRPPGAQWMATKTLGHTLWAAELGKGEGARVRSVFFGDGDPRAVIEALRTKPEQARKELRALAGTVSLRPRPGREGVQPDGRIALVWWDTRRDRPRRSASAKDNAFDPKTDRLLAAVAVLDNRAIRQGKWVPREDVPLLGLPDGWPKAEQAVRVRGPAVGLALAAASPLDAGDYTAEAAASNAFRSAVEDRIALWVMNKAGGKAFVNEGDRVVVLTVYEYDERHKHIPVGYRFYAVSASGRLEAQCHFWLHDRKKWLMSAETECERFDDN